MQYEQSSGAHTINGFCATHKISRTKLYDLWLKGSGPRFYLVGNRRRISAEAAAEWRRAMESAAEQGQNQ